MMAVSISHMVGVQRPRAFYEMVWQDISAEGRGNTGIGFADVVEYENDRWLRCHGVTETKLYSKVPADSLSRRQGYNWIAHHSQLDGFIIQP
jgi:hypothetical protein